MNKTKIVNNIEELYEAANFFEKAKTQNIDQKDKQEERIENLEQQVQVLLEQNKNMLEYIKQLATAITESNSDISQ